MDILSMYPEYLRKFNRDDYRAAFENYKTGCRDFFAGLSAESISREIDGIMLFAADELRRRPGRKARCFDLRSFLCVYLCPAALEHGTEAAREFAFALAARWSSSYPEFRFEPGSFDDIAAGFRTKPFSF